MNNTLSTSRFGELHMNEDDIIRFSSGIPGFEEHRRWVLAGEEENQIFWLQSVDDGDLALPVGLAELLHPGYNARIPREQLEQLEPIQEGQLSTLLVISIPPSEPWEMTANFKAPIVINRGNRTGTQTLALNEDYDFSHYLLDESVRRGMRVQAASSGAD